MWTGFGINAVSGMLLLIAYPTKQLTNPVFYIKLTLIGLAIWVMVRIKTRVFDDASLSQAAMTATGKTMAKWSLVFWGWSHHGGALAGVHIPVFGVWSPWVVSLNHQTQYKSEPFVNFAHLHLLLNHIPVIGTIIGFCLFLASFFGKNDDLRRSSLIIFAVVALLTIPTFLLGFGAQAEIKGLPGVSDALIERHEGAAMLSFWFMLITGALALGRPLAISHGPHVPARGTCYGHPVFFSS